MPIATDHIPVLVQKLASAAAPTQEGEHPAAGRCQSGLTAPSDAEPAPGARAAQVSKAALTAVRLQDNGRMMAVGAADGSTTVLRLSAGLADMQANEKTAFLAVRCRSRISPNHASTATLSLNDPSLSAVAFSCQPGAGQ